MEGHTHTLFRLPIPSSVLLILLSLTLLSGCGDIADKDVNTKSFSAPGDPAVGTGGKLFVANSGGASLLVYDPDARAAGLTMNGLATRTAGSSTGSVTQSGVFTGDVLTTIFQVDITDGTATGGPSASDPLTFTFSISRDSGTSFGSSSSPIVVTGTTAVSLQEGVSVAFTGPLEAGDRFRVRPIGDQTPDRRVVDLAAAHAGMALDTVNDRLFVANPANNSLIIFTSVSSPTPTTRVLSGPSTGLTRPFAVAVDTVRDLLYVANTGVSFQRNEGIRVFEVPPGFTGGNVAPLRTFSGFNDCLGGKCLNFPRGLFVDSANDRLYVANSSMNNVLVFERASLQNGIAPQEDMRVICTQPDATTPGRCVFPTIQGGPLSVFVDTTKNILYVGHADNSIYVFNNASTLNCTATAPCPPDRRIFGLDTRLSDPVGIVVTSADQLFVASNGLNALLRFDHASTQDGNVPPTKIIAGNPTLANPVGTRLIDPVSVQVDTTAGGVLYAADGTNIIPVFSPINPPDASCTLDPRVSPPTTSPFTPVLTCNVAPTKVLTSGQTTMASPQGIYFDKDADADAGPGTGILYVTDFNQGSILIFHNATELPLVTGAPTNRRPDRVIYGPATRLTVNGPRGIFVDTNVAANAADNNIYVAVSGAAGANADAILVFNNAVGGICSTNPATGTLKLGELFCQSAANVPPSRIIQGSNTKLLAPSGLFLDKTTNNLYVTNSRGSSITVFNQALTVNGDVVPTRTISGAATELNSPQGIVVDTTANHIYVANAGNDLATTTPVEDPSLLIFANASTASGSPVPLRKISGSHTTLFDPIGLQLDIVGGVVREIYVANSGRNSIVVFCLDAVHCGGAPLQNGNNNIAPRRIISGRSTTLSAPAGLFFVP